MPARFQEHAACLKTLTLRLKWPFTEWETGPEQKSRKNGKENGKWPQARNGRKMAIKMEKWTRKWDFGLILAIFSISAAIFRPFQASGHFPFSFPFFSDFCSGPISHSVNGHCNRNPNLLKLRSLDPSCPFFLSKNSIWWQWVLTCPKCCDREARIAFRTSKCCIR